MGFFKFLNTVYEGSLFRWGWHSFTVAAAWHEVGPSEVFGCGLSVGSALWCMSLLVGFRLFGSVCVRSGRDMVFDVGLVTGKRDSVS